jgi:1-deoxyxylulose-5-phosphate synthase
MIDLLVEVAGELGKTPSQVALSWLLGDQRVTAAIIGARKLDQLEENLEAGDLDLPPEMRQRLTDGMPLKLGYPYEWQSLNLPATFDKAEFKPGHTVKVPL